MTNIISGQNLGEVVVGEDKIFDALAITDTSNHDSSISDNRFFIPRTILIENTLNQSVTITVQGSRYADFTRFVTVGNGFVVPSGGDAYATIADYLPFLRLRANCIVAPASGSLTAYVLKRS